MKKVVFTFGRFQPPTIGHQLVVDTVLKKAREIGGDAIIFASPSHDNKTNPIPFKDKVKFLKMAFPQVKVSDDPKLINPFYAAMTLSNQGYKEVYIVADEPRGKVYKTNISRYIGHEDPKKAYNFSHFDVVIAGERDPDAEGVVGMSASKLRAYAVEGNLEGFLSGLAKGISRVQGTKLYKMIRKNLGIKESYALSIPEMLQKIIRNIP
jgi:hypothetical protein